MTVRIVTDSSCDILPEEATALGIEIVPLTIRFGSDEFRDREELSNEEFWERVRTSPVLPETAAPSVGAFESAFTRLVEEGATGILCINLSSRLSATMQSAQLAAKALEGVCPVAVVDSRSVSMGLGLQCLTAAEAARRGAGLDELVRKVEDQAGRTFLYGALDTLENLRKGGRIGAAQALLGSALSIKPVVAVRDGVVAQAAKVRTRTRSLRWLADRLAEAGPTEAVCVFEANADDLDQLLDMLPPTIDREQVRIGRIGPVIGTHCGPGTLGVGWVAAA